LWHQAARNFAGTGAPARNLAELRAEIAQVFAYVRGVGWERKMTEFLNGIGRDLPPTVGPGMARC
jgi:hypothetical protein